MKLQIAFQNKPKCLKVKWRPCGAVFERKLYAVWGTFGSAMRSQIDELSFEQIGRHVK